MVEETGILMTEPVMILTPNVAGQQVVQRGDWRPPWNVSAGFYPFGMLVNHGVDDVNEGLIAAK